MPAGYICRRQRASCLLQHGGAELDVNSVNRRSKLTRQQRNRQQRNQQLRSMQSKPASSLQLSAQQAALRVQTWERRRPRQGSRSCQAG